MAIDTALLIAQVRSNINEGYGNDDAMRSDPEITAWLEQAQEDYVAKCPADSFPELITESTFTGSSWTIATDYLKLLEVKLTHTVSGTETEIVTAFILPVNGGYVAEQYDGGLGAWAQFKQGVIKVGPNAISGTITYQSRPTTLQSGCPTLELDDAHAGPIVDYATSKALDKINDADSDKYMRSYELRVQAENRKFGIEYDIEKVE